MNPGPTCRERANTVMSLSVLTAIRKRRRTAERGDAKCLLCSHQDTVHLASDASSSQRGSEERRVPGKGELRRKQERRHSSLQLHDQLQNLLQLKGATSG